VHLPFLSYVKEATLPESRQVLYVKLGIFINLWY